MIHDQTTEWFRPDSRVDLHPLARLGRGEARDFGAALSLLEAGSEIELAEARRAGDAGWVTTLRDYRRRLTEACHVYRQAHAAADVTAAEELRRRGLDEFAGALCSGHHERLAW